jgi:ATP-dependent Clp protease protease subunit
MERDKFMSPVEAKEFGLIDKILEHPSNDETPAESSAVST